MKTIVKFIAIFSILVFLSSIAASDRDEVYDCVVLDGNPVWLNTPNGAPYVYQGQTSWIRIPVKIVQQTGRSVACDWIRRILFNVTVDASSAQGQINVYNVDEAIRDNTLPIHYSDEGYQTATGVNYLFTSEWTKSSVAPERQFVFFFVEANEEAKISKQNLELKLRASMCDHEEKLNTCATGIMDNIQEWIDQETFCKCQTNYVACLALVEKGQATTTQCNSDKTLCDTICEKRIELLYTNFQDSLMGEGKPITYQILAPYTITLKNYKSKFEIGKIAEFVFTIKNVGIENLINPQLIIKIPESFEDKFLPGSKNVKRIEEGDDVVFAFDLVQNIEKNVEIDVTVPFYVKTSTFAGSYNFDVRLHYSGFTTKIVPKTQYEPTQSFSLTGTAPKVSYTLIDPKSKIAYELPPKSKRTPMTVIKPIEDTLILNYQVSNYDPNVANEGYVHNCFARLSVPVDTLEITDIVVSSNSSQKHFNASILTTESEVQYSIPFGDLDRAELKEVIYTFKVLSGPEVLFEPKFELVECKAPDNTDYIQNPTVKYYINRTTLDYNLEFTPSPLKSRYDPKELIPIKLELRNPSTIDFGNCTISVKHPGSFVFISSNPEGIKTSSGREFVFPIGPNGEETLEYSIRSDTSVASTQITVDAQCNGINGEFKGATLINTPPVQVENPVTPIPSNSASNPLVDYFPFILIGGALVILLLLLRIVRKKKAMKEKQEDSEDGEKKEGELSEKVDEKDSKLSNKIDNLLNEVTKVKEEEVGKKPEKKDVKEVKASKSLEKHLDEEKKLMDQLEFLGSLSESE